MHNNLQDTNFRDKNALFLPYKTLSLSFYHENYMIMMEKKPYEDPRIRIVSIRFEHVLMTPSNQLPPSDEFDGGDY